MKLQALYVVRKLGDLSVGSKLTLIRGFGANGNTLPLQGRVKGSIPLTSTIYVNAGSLTVTDTTGVMSPTAARFDSSIDTNLLY